MSTAMTKLNPVIDATSPKFFERLSSLNEISLIDARHTVRLPAKKPVMSLEIKRKE